MHPNEIPTSARPTPPKSNAVRYTLTLVLMVAVIGGVAWVAQYLPSLKKKTNVQPPPPDLNARILEFPRWIAQWDNKKSSSKDGTPEKSDDPLAKEEFQPKVVEFGKQGHYDFPFKNISGKDVEITHFFSSCDCTSVMACALPLAEWKKINDQQSLKPADPVVYAPEPTWYDLQNKQQHDTDPERKRILTVKADEGGVVRVRWTVKKTPGQTLKLNPQVTFHAVDNPTEHRQEFRVPVTVGASLRFHPPRVHVGVLKPGGKPAVAEFDAWSSTRKEFALKLTTLPPNPFFQIESRPLSAAECADLAVNLNAETADKTETSKKSEPAVPARVLSGHHIKVTVYETKNGEQLDQGPFYQKLAIELDGFPEHELPGPEVVGRVQGDIRVGGESDQGKIIFKTFRAGDEAYKEVPLLTDANVKLIPHAQEPAFLEVKVTRDKDQPDPKKARWTLRVTVPANTPGVRSFEETDHVTLRIAGRPERFLRIAIEGHAIGR